MQSLDRVINFRIPIEVHNKMKEIAEREERPISYIARKSIVSFVEDYPNSKRILEPKGRARSEA